jgi:hypothetical protein
MMLLFLLYVSASVQAGQLCDSNHCAFASPGVHGGVSSLTPTTTTVALKAAFGDCGVTEGFFTDSNCTEPVTPPPYGLVSNPINVPKGKCVQTLASGAGSECVSCTPGATAVLNLFMEGCGHVGTTATSPEGKCLSDGKYYQQIKCDTPSSQAQLPAAVAAARAPATPASPADAFPRDRGPGGGSDGVGAGACMCSNLTTCCTLWSGAPDPGFSCHDAGPSCNAAVCQCTPRTPRPNAAAAAASLSGPWDDLGAPPACYRDVALGSDSVIYAVAEQVC